MCMKCHGLALCASRCPGGPALVSLLESSTACRDLPEFISSASHPPAVHQAHLLAWLLHPWLGTAALIEGRVCSPVLRESHQHPGRLRCPRSRLWPREASHHPLASPRMLFFRFPCSKLETLGSEV